MAYRVETGREPRQPYAAVRTTARMSEIGEHMGPLFGQLLDWLARNGLEASGPPWARYLVIGPEEVEFEIGAPLAEDVAGGNGVRAGVRPACEVASTVHTGPYGEMEPAYQAIGRWLTEHGRLAAGAPWEVYETGPGSEPDPAKWRTRVVFPLSSTG